MTDDERRERLRFRQLLDRSSIGRGAWVDCPIHGHQARDPDTDRCIACP